MFAPVEGDIEGDDCTATITDASGSRTLHSIK